MSIIGRLPHALIATITSFFPDDREAQANERVFAPRNPGEGKKGTGMNRTIHRLFAGVAAVGIALAGLATGAATANADVPTASTESGTITINGEGATGHTFSAYPIAAYNSNYSWSQADDVSNLSLVLPSSTGTEISNVLQSSTGLTDINKLTGQDGTDWGLDSGTATSDVRKFAKALAADTANLGTAQPLSAGITNTVTPEGVYLIVDTTALPDGATTTASVPMIVGSTLAKADAADDTSTVAPGTVDVKNTVITVHKQVVKDDGTTPNNNPSYKLGDTITFQLSTVIPNFSGYGKNATDLTAANARVLQLTDAFSKGLTYDGITSVTVEGVADQLKADTDFTVTTPTPTTTDGGTLTVDFGKLVNQASGSALVSDLSSYYGKKITVLVTAHLNSNAIIATAGTDTTVTGDDPNGNPNTVSVTFSNNPSDNSHKSTTPGDTVNVYSFKYTVKKTGQGDDADGLSGAKFTIKDSTGNYLAYNSDTKQWSSLGTTEPTATSGTDSTTAGIFTSAPDIEFYGLKEGTYTVHEVQAPAGYLSINLPTFTFTITATYNNDTTNTTEASNSGDDSLKTLTYSASATGTSSGYIDGGTDGTVTVKNFTSITQLPKTGAAGIALFSVIGLALVAAAVVFGIRARGASRLA
jgi:fimbrial isopeptide formation D2 family protein/LPXTG-motif cell wall-anchored protein